MATSSCSSDASGACAAPASSSILEIDVSRITLPKLQKLHADGVKIAMLTCYDSSFAALLEEGGAEFSRSIGFLTRRGIPVCGHLGLTPQSVHQLGGYRVQGKTADSADQLLADAVALQDAGAGMIVLEAIPAELARRVTAELHVPTIAIRAGPDCSGQVLVLHDMLD